MMKRKNFLLAIGAALGVCATGTDFRPSEDVPVAAPTPSPVPPCLRCGGSGQIIVEKPGHSGITSLAEGSGLPVPYGALYESRSCPECVRFPVRFIGEPIKISKELQGMIEPVRTYPRKAVKGLKA